MTVKEIDCTYAEQHDLAALYLAGKLPEAEAEAFEMHYLGCERCWAGIRQGGEIRAAFGKPLIEPIPADPSRGFGSNAWTLIAATAAVAAIALGVLQLSRRPETTPLEPAYRGATAQELSLDVDSRPAGTIRLSWSQVDEARTFVAEVVTSDGATVWRRETSDTTVSLRPGELPPPRSGISFFTRVEARDTMGRVVATSGLKAMPLR